MKEVELENFIKNTLKQIENSINPNKRWLKEGVEIEISISKIKEVKGGLKIYVLTGEGQTGTQEVAKIKFEVKPFLTQKQVSEINRWHNITQKK